MVFDATFNNISVYMVAVSFSFKKMHYYSMFKKEEEKGFKHILKYCADKNTCNALQQIVLHLIRPRHTRYLKSLNREKLWTNFILTV